MLSRTASLALTLTLTLTLALVASAGAARADEEAGSDAAAASAGQEAGDGAAAASAGQEAGSDEAAASAGQEAGSDGAAASAGEEAGSVGAAAGPPDAARTTPPPYDAGDGLTPLADLPTWGEGDDHDGCSCRLTGSESAAPPGLACAVAAFTLLRARRTQRCHRDESATRKAVVR
jgi:hypothetical protein